MSWTKAKLGDVTTILNGTTPDSSNPAYWNGHNIWVTPTDLGKLNGHVINTSLRLISDAGRSSCNLPLVPVGAVIMSSRAPIGHLAISGRSLYTNQGCKSFVCRPFLDSEFLYYTLKHRMPEIKALGSGATFIEVSKSTLEDFEILFPGLEEQRQIAARLRAQLAEVEKAHSAAEAQQPEFLTLRRSIFKSALNGYSKFVPLGSISNIQLGKMLSPKSKTGQTPFIYLRNQNVQWGRFDLSSLASMDFSDDERVKFQLKPGDLLICEGGEPGRCAVWNGEISDCYYQKALHRLRPHNEIADSEFLSYWIRFQAMTGAFEDQNAKTTIAHLPLVRLEKLPVPDINIFEQRRVVKAIKKDLILLESAHGAAQNQLNEINALPAKILSQAFEM